jgi:hypothetical protein
MKDFDLYSEREKRPQAAVFDLSKQEVLPLPESGPNTLYSEDFS